MDSLRPEQVSTKSAELIKRKNPGRRKFIRYGGLVALSLLGLAGISRGSYGALVETRGGWVKVSDSPVVGGSLGTCFDMTLLKEAELYRMWFSWRPKLSIAYIESSDGVHWSAPVIALGPEASTGWEDEVNRPVVIHEGNLYQMWYTGQSQGRSVIGYATSPDGRRWQRGGSSPVLNADRAWEKEAVMCPSVLRGGATGQYEMWYSGGEQYEPDAIGYATSLDGHQWQKQGNGPIFVADPQNSWEGYKVTACQVLRYQDWYLMFYIGFSDNNHAQIGLARSRDGIKGWQRHPANPIVRPGINPTAWDHDAVYKPYALLDNDRWLLWYNGRRASVEQIGLVSHAGTDLGFETTG